MTVFEAILLGLVQGLTEFLPISSTAHLTLAGKLLGLIDPAHPETWTAFMAVIQLGTLAAVIAYFWRDIVAMTVAVVRDARRGKNLGALSGETKLAILVLLGTLPVALIGLSLRHVIEGALTKDLIVIVCSLIVLALLLWLAEKVARHTRSLPQANWRDALIIGIAQALALIPGSSRSGTTITAGLFLGLTRETAARFSFLLSIPAVFASGVYEMSKIHWGAFELGAAHLVLATVVAGVSGYAAIAWLLRYLMKNTTMLFVWYRIALGLLLTAFLIAHIITP